MNDDEGAGEDARPGAARDDEYIEGYAKGYGDGLREALREFRSHASRGASPQELRMLIESRLARIPEDVEVRRKGLLAPPRRAAWANLLRPPAAPAWSPPKSTLPAVPLAPGLSLLVKEERPERALELLRANAGKYRRVVLVSQRPPSLGDVPPEHIETIVPAASRADGNAPGGSLDPSAIAGRIGEIVASGSALIYLDAIEFLATEYTAETTVRFVGWLVKRGVESGSAVLVCLAPRSLEPRDLSRVERAFDNVR